MLTLLISTINPSNAALSVQTVKVIQGSAPYFILSDGTKLKDLNVLLGFSMPKRDGSKGRERIDSTSTELVLAKTMKFSEIEYTVYHQHDDDGDADTHFQALSITWMNRHGEVITDLNQVLSLCDAPYTLTISVNNLTAQTAYGIPHQSDNYGSATKTYAFMLSGREICYIKPQSMQIYTNNTLYPQGYNPAVWDKDEGFSVSKMKVAGKYFPTTGFDKAVFDVIGSGNDQSQYRCSKTGDWIRLSGDASQDLGQNCRVTYNHDKKRGNPTKPTTPITITMEYKNDNNSWTKIGSYTIPVPSKWAISPVGESYRARYSNLKSHNVVQPPEYPPLPVRVYPALTACRKVGPRADNKTTNWEDGAGRNAWTRAFRQRFMYRRDELTNSKIADRARYPEGSNASGTSYYSRDIGTFMGEWGYVQSYKQSPWSAYPWYWTTEMNSKKGGNQFIVIAHGDVAWNHNLTNNYVAVCRGE